MHPRHHSPTNHPAPSDLRSFQAGGALIYVITIATVLLGLFAISIYHMRTGSHLISEEKWKGQASLISQSGIAYLQKRLAADLRDTAKAGWIFEPISLHYDLDSMGMGFDLSAKRLGLQLHVLSVGVVGNRVDDPSARSEALLASGIILADLPALALTDKNAGITLGGTSGIRGPAMVWREGITKSTDSHIRWKGGVGHEGALWDSASNKWSDLEIDFKIMEGWFDGQEKWVSGIAGKRENADGNGIMEAERSDSLHLSDTLVSSSRMVSKGIVRLDRGVRLENCEVSGALVIIEPGVFLKNTLVFSSSKIIGIGPYILGGQYFAVDTIRLLDETELIGGPIFMVKGRNRVSQQGEVIPTGALTLAKVKGMGVFISVPGKGRMISNLPSLTVGKDAQVSGFFYTGGLADIKSDIQGSVFCHNLVSVENGNIRMGCLNDARIEQDVSNRYLPGPLVFPDFPIIPLPLPPGGANAEET